MFSRLQQFVNDETTIMVLNALVLILVLVWLLSGGFSFRGRKPGKGRKGDKEDRR